MKQKRLVGIRLFRSMIGIWVCGSLSALHGIFSAVTGDHTVLAPMMGINLLAIFFALRAMQTYWSGAGDDPEIREVAASEMSRTVRIVTEHARRTRAAVLTRWRERSPSCELGAIGNLAKARAKAEVVTGRPCGRQSGPASISRRQASGTKSGSDDPDGDGGDGGIGGEPPAPARPVAQQQLWSYRSFAQILDLAENTVRNRVSAGTLPPPLKTAVGPRFTPGHLEQILHPAHRNAATPRGRGRPRIAQVLGKRGAR